MQRLRVHSQLSFSLHFFSEPEKFKIQSIPVTRARKILTSISLIYLRLLTTNWLFTNAWWYSSKPQWFLLTISRIHNCWLSLLCPIWIQILSYSILMYSDVLWRFLWFHPYTSSLRNTSLHFLECLPQIFLPHYKPFLQNHSDWEVLPF